MEAGVWLTGLLLRLLEWLLMPVFWLASRGGRAVPGPEGPLLRLSATELARRIRSRQVTSEEVVSAYIERVKKVNVHVNAVVEERFRAALDEARHVDRQLAAGVQLEGKPLLGVPFTVKESCSLGGLSNSVGCLEHAGRRAPRDGEAVRLVREAGAIPLLVSNTPELCLGWESTNPLRGTTNNPYCLTRTPGGSSGGEAALVASGASPFGVASDIAGSTRIPAAFCGLFGHKASPGIVSIEGHVPYLCDPLFSQVLGVGPLARHAEDLPLLLTIMAGEKASMLRLDDPVDFSQLKVLFMTEASTTWALMPTAPRIKQLVVSAAHYLRDECGATLSDEKFEEFEDSVEMSISMFFSMKDIPNMLQDPANPKRNKSLVLELVKYMFGGGSRSLQALGFSLIDRTKLFIPADKHRHYQEKAKRLREHIISRLGSNGVLLYPVFAEAAHAHRGVFPRASAVVYTMLFNVLGLPACAVPAHQPDSTLPLSLQVIAAPNQDRLCLAVAKKLEERFGGWRPPA